MLRPTQLGNLNITVSTKIDTKYVGKCGPEVQVRKTIYRDVITKCIQVKPEGFPYETTQSTYLCLNDMVNGSESGRLVWDFKIPENMVENSEQGKITLVGEIMGPAFQVRTVSKFLH